ncbi:DUF3270 family protein [Streptococcus moroccensis]|uniref:Small-conductance mechanosensitive channel n=1 Tax=Streptococcus moroccensis TaxID=1451356 RepID=A0ABT9YSF0_9STRE|nr:DUF3270 family protein [Streptococcus moroccensis]MDQ0222531.1 small-conductance mechanosensitive channel [Streptococcus moroccensis]
MALRDYKYDQENVVPLRPTASYDAYEESKEEETQVVEEILFFANIAIFAIASVLSIFILSALKLNTVLAFVLGIGTGILALQACRVFLKKYQNQLKKTD